MILFFEMMVGYKDYDNRNGNGWQKNSCCLKNTNPSLKSERVSKTLTLAEGNCQEINRSAYFKN
jgi:hypothetical protein